MPKPDRKRRPHIEPHTGQPCWPGMIGAFKPFPHLPQSQQAASLAALADRLRGGRIRIGDDGYPYIAAPTATQLFEKDSWDVKEGSPDI